MDDIRFIPLKLNNVQEGTYLYEIGLYKTVEVTQIFHQTFQLEPLTSGKFSTSKAREVISWVPPLPAEFHTSGPDRGGCTDTFDWTPQSVNGQPYNAQDNKVWTCPTVDTTAVKTPT